MCLLRVNDSHLSPTPFKNILCMLLLLLPSVLLAKDSLEGIAVMSLSSHDQAAVVRLADGSMHSLVIGDSIPGTKTKLLEVLADKLVLEESLVKTDGMKVKETVWLYKTIDRHQQSRIQRLDKIGPPPTVIEQPYVIDVKTTEKNSKD